MTRLTQQALEFAREHIERFYDSDFFPKPLEYEALWHNWDEVVTHLTSTNIHKLVTYPARTAAWKKHRGGYRVVHQLDPIDALVYCSLVYQISEAVEHSRAPVEEKIACSYRISLDDGSFFSDGSGFDDFREKSVELAHCYGYVLSVDIADFYNQIYSHRVQNAIHHVLPENENLADDIESFLNKLNSKTSQGIPVGPAPSIVIAEAIMIDVDQFLTGLGYEHTRYVDDFRIFGNSEPALERALIELTLYLYSAHRLSISSDKTYIRESKAFLANDINNPYELAKIELLEKLPAVDGYSGHELEPDEKEEVLFEIETAREKIRESITALVSNQPLDLGFCRALIRQARALRDFGSVSIVLSNLKHFEPVVNNFIIYLDAVTTDQLIVELEPKMEELIPVLSECTDMTRKWFEWYWTEHHDFLQSDRIRNYIRSGPNVESISRVAVAFKDVAWVRGQKDRYFELPSDARRSVLIAASLLPRDERKHWLQSVADATAIPLEKWLAKYVLDRTDDVFGLTPFDDDIPF